MKIYWGGKDLPKGIVLQIVGLIFLIAGFAFAIKCTAELEGKIAETKLMQYLTDKLQEKNR